MNSTIPTRCQLWKVIKAVNEVMNDLRVAQHFPPQDEGLAYLAKGTGNREQGVGSRE
ncbi:MAG: hypothetical protein F6J98_28005 [Moorea sp. SIO4G2]|uniref:hypothetical protein n=1 Tax=unclassified Moorena TaxID=2683338 RepID=UPI0013CAD4E4|nr:MULTISPECIES: hypothetical protein [unclassified Moorena]NEO19413.1 hypothetical protein [Moorena sp. SIO4A5]NEO64053.1 hypothetical protein [Moorena sp. SIO4G2]NEQ59249.1 hypothetical protein [Moorena sp. SIO4A1]